eukprot:1638983-Amphidinium_carterae.1
MALEHIASLMNSGETFRVAYVTQDTILQLVPVAVSVPVPAGFCVNGSLGMCDLIKPLLGLVRTINVILVIVAAAAAAVADSAQA